MASSLDKMDATHSGAHAAHAAHAAHRDVVSIQAPKVPWRWQHYLALIAGLFLVWGAWTLVAWLAAGPRPVTVYRDPAASAYSIATAYEVVAVTLVLGVGAYVIRGCVRDRRLTFDAQLCIAGLLAYWLDPFYNFFVPMNLYSSNFFNVGKLVQLRAICCQQGLQRLARADPGHRQHLSRGIPCLRDVGRADPADGRGALSERFDGEASDRPRGVRRRR